MAARYSPTHQVLHWVTVVLMFAVLPLAWIATSIPDDTKEYYYWLDVQKCIGLTILILTVGGVWLIDPQRCQRAMAPGTGGWHMRWHGAYC